MVIFWKNYGQILKQLLLLDVNEMIKSKQPVKIKNDAASKKFKIIMGFQ